MPRDPSGRTAKEVSTSMTETGEDTDRNVHASRHPPRRIVNSKQATGGEGKKKKKKKRRKRRKRKETEKESEKENGKQG
jgi:hypothetical protein